MDTIEIIISSPDHGITWNAWLGDEQILAGVHTPVFDACRVLLARGVDPSTKVASRHAGQPYRSLTTTVGYGARMTVAERGRGMAFEPYKPFKPFSAGSAKDGRKPPEGTGTAHDPLSAAGGATADAQRAS